MLNFMGSTLTLAAAEGQTGRHRHGEVKGGGGLGDERVDEEEEDE